MADEKDAPVGAKGQESPQVESFEVKMPSEAFKKRLDEASQSERKRLLKEFGFESLEDGKRALRLFKEMQDATLTEQQRIAKELDELKPRASKAEKRAEKLAAKLTAIVEEQFNALPDAAREAIDEIAEGDPEERLKLITAMRKAGLVGGETPLPSKASEASTTTATTGGAPKQAPPGTKYTEWQELSRRSQTLGDLFYQNHVHEIERDRPAQ
jgi:hypothetical protein